MRTKNILGFLMEYLLDIYQGKKIFVFNNTEVRFGLRDMALISGMNVESPSIRKFSSQVSSFLLGLKQVSYQEISQAVFVIKFVSMVDQEERKFPCRIWSLE